MANDTNVASPVSWPPSSYWDGNDGLWNTFHIQVGTPPQDFRILPSTAGQETWLPYPAGCVSADPSNPGYCGYLRGALPFHGANSSGFQTNQSSSWSSIGIYTLDAQELQLGYSGNGLYGFDTVTLGSSSEALSETKQVVAGVADLDFWLGVFGLGPDPINFTTFNNPIPSYMSDLVSNKSIPSLSWGYTAGAHYRDQAPASLTLGGYDTNRFEPSSFSFFMSTDNSRPLQVGVQQIIGQNTLGGSGAVNLLPTSTYHFIDSTLPHIWLPSDAIEVFVANFGLTYDNNTDLFLVNDSIHSQLLRLNPTITFQLGNSTVADGAPTQNIVLPYSAFDLQASYPFYQNATNYFPIRKASNESQYTIGRTFLQEAYLIADFERNNFTVAQTSFANMSSSHLVPIDPPIQVSVTASPEDYNTSHSLSGGAIAGVVIGVIVGLTLLLGAVLLCIRHGRQRCEALPTFDPEKPFVQSDVVLPGDTKFEPYTCTELPHDSLVEAPARQGVLEMDTSGQTRAEMEDDLGMFRSTLERAEMPTPPYRQESSVMVEVPGGEKVRYELVGSAPR